MKKMSKSMSKDMPKKMDKKMNKKPMMKEKSMMMEAKKMGCKMKG